MMHGVTRRKNRGLPSCIIQNEGTNIKAEKIRGMTKAVVLEGDPNCPNVVAFSVHDTRCVHFYPLTSHILGGLKSRKRFMM